MRKHPRLTALVAVLTPLVCVVAYRPPLLDGVSFSRAIYDESHRLLRVQLAADDRYRLFVPLSGISPTVIEATLLQEDQHFRRHFGVNIFSLARAAWRAVVPAGRRVGASTITMQLARVRYRIRSRSVPGKLFQIFRALQLELHYGKDEILEAYLNLAPYGGNVEGVGAAALVYFGKRADALALPEALTLAVIPQSPALRTPEARVSPSLGAPLVTARRDLFERWAAAHPEDRARETDVALPLDLTPRAKLPFLAPHFVNALEPLPADARDVTTTLDLRLQRLLERQARTYLAGRKGAGMKNASAMIVDWRSMEVKALLGSVDFFDASIHGQVNGTRARRSPGSTLKPFLYALGIEQGHIHPMTMLKDTPTAFAEYDPENSDRDFVGPIKVKDALIRSRNVPALQVANRLKPGLYSFLKTAGIAGLRPEARYGLALVLGGGEMTMEELVRLYAMLANEGVQKPLRFRRDEPKGAELRLLSPEASFLVLQMLADNPPPGQNFRSDWVRRSLPVAWKTGTSFGFRDAWTIGIAGPYVIGVWVGNFNGESNPGLLGRDTAAPLLFRLVDAIRSERPVAARPFEYRGKDLKEVRVCSLSGDLPGPFCRHTLPTTFIPGRSPIQTCSIHREIHVDKRTGLRVCGTGGTNAVAEVFEFWPSDLLRLFRQAGIPRRAPPPDSPDCPLDARASRGLPPEITSPRRELEYTMRAALTATERIPLTAVSDSDVRTLYWFIDEKYVGKSPAGESHFWKPGPGKFTVRVVDDQGRADAREIKVAVVE